MAAPSCLCDLLPPLRHTKCHLDLPHTIQAKQYTLTTKLVANWKSYKLERLKITKILLYKKKQLPTNNTNSNKYNNIATLLSQSDKTEK